MLDAKVESIRLITLNDTVIAFNKLNTITNYDGATLKFINYTVTNHTVRKNLHFFCINLSL